MPTSTALANIAAMALLIATLAVVGLHVRADGFNSVRDAVSLYVHARFGMLYDVQVAATGVAALCLLGALLARGHTLPAFGLSMLGLYGASRLAIVAFPADRKSPLTTRGRVHMTLALCAFVSIAFAAGALTGPVRAIPFWHGPGTLIEVAKVVSVGAVWLTILSRIWPATRRVFGLIERGIYAGAFAWMACVLWGLLA